MLTITLRDLQWRARRFGLGVAATALVFSTTLLLIGVLQSFRHEADRAIASFAGDRWIIPAGATGPLTAAAPFGPELGATVARFPGVRSVAEVVLARAVVRRQSGKEVLVNVVGVRPSFMAPRLV